MSVSLDKDVHTYAFVEFGELTLRGKIVKRHHGSVTIKVESCLGRATMIEYPVMVGAIHRFMITDSVTLFR